MNDDALDLLDKLLVYDPAGRMSAKAACVHPYFGLGSLHHAARKGEEY